MEPEYLRLSLGIADHHRQRHSWRRFRLGPSENEGREYLQHVCEQNRGSSLYYYFLM